MIVSEGVREMPAAHPPEFRILQRVEDGSMPCDGTWGDEQRQTFRAWVDKGTPA